MLKKTVTICALSLCAFFVLQADENDHLASSNLCEESNNQDEQQDNLVAYKNKTKEPLLACDKNDEKEKGRDNEVASSHLLSMALDEQEENQLACKNCR